MIGIGAAIVILLIAFGAFVAAGLPLLVALVAMLGEANWYLPKWLEWLPHLQVEGESAQYLEPGYAPVPVH